MTDPLFPSGEKLVIDEKAATYAPEKIQMLADRLELKQFIVWIVENKLDTATTPASNRTLDKSLEDGSFMIWTLCAYFPAIHNLAVADTISFSTGTSLADYCANAGGAPSKGKTDAVETAEIRLISLFVAFACLGKSNTTRATGAAPVARFVENEALGRRFKAMVAGKRLPKETHGVNFCAALPAGALDNGQRAIWTNNTIAKTAIGWILTGNPTAEADKALIEQMRMIYGGAEMTFAKTVNDFLQQCNNRLVTMPRVVEEADQLLSVMEDMQKKHNNHHLHLRLLHHTDANLLAPNAFPYLAGAVTFWINKRNAVLAQGTSSTVQQATLNIRTNGYSQDEMQANYSTPLPPGIKGAIAQAYPARYQKATGIQSTAKPTQSAPSAVGQAGQTVILPAGISATMLAHLQSLGAVIQ